MSSPTQDEQFGVDRPKAGLTTPITKVTLPHLSEQILPRTRLTDVLDQMVPAHPVTLVTAPAGYGKTTLLALWAEHAEHTVAWLTVDSFDQDPRRLFKNMLAALQIAAHSNARTDADRLLSMSTARNRGAAWPGWADQHDEFLRALEEFVAPVVLILDDLQEISGASANDLLARLMRLTPRHFHLVLSSRTHPDLPLQRLHLGGGLGELGERDLAFTPAEVRDLAAACGAELKPAEVASLTALTRGWPAAVRIALFSIDHEPAASRMLSGMELDDLQLNEYLSQEVLGSLRPELAEFVLRATIGDWINADLADRLHHSDQGAHLLAEVMRAGAFLSAQTGEEPALYRWHSVFAAQCRAILRRQSPKLALELQRTAADYWRTHNAYESIAAAIAANEMSLAVDVLTERWPELLLHGDPGSIGQLCVRIPPPLAEDPEVQQLRFLAEILDGGSGTQVREQARAGAAGLPPSRRARFDLVDHLFDAFFIPDHHDLVESIHNTGAVLKASQKAPVAQAFGHFLVGEAAAQLQHDLPSAQAHLHAAAERAVEQQLPMLTVACAASMTIPMFISGHFDEADASAREVLAKARRNGRHWTSTMVPAYLTCGLADFWRDEPLEAKDNLLQVIRLAASRQHGYALQAALMLELIALGAGDAAAAEQARSLARTHAGHLPDSVTAGFTRMMDGATAAAHGDFEHAVTLAQGLDQAEGHPVVNLWQAETLRRAGDPTAARAALARIPPGRRVAHIDVGAGLTEALLEADRGRTADAHRRLEHVLEIASGPKIRRPFRERAPELRGLLYAHHSWGTHRGEFLAEVLARTEERTDSPRRRTYWELTDRELTVLTYLRSPMTTAEIAEALFVSPNTVKTHMRAIYRKLGAAGRREATRIASAGLGADPDDGSTQGASGQDGSGQGAE